MSDVNVLREDDVYGLMFLEWKMQKRRISEGRIIMRKKLMAILLGSVLVFTMITPAFAQSESFSLKNVNGTVSLTKNTSSATGKTAYGVGKSVTAVRKVTVTLKCKKGGTTYTYSDTNSAVTNSGNYNSTTASVTVYRPSSSYTVSSAVSSHEVSVTSGSYSRSLSL